MKKILLVIIVFISHNLLAQPETLIVVIDTVLFESKNDGYNLNLKPCGGFFSGSDYFTEQKEVSLDRYPNYIKRINLPVGITTIEIPIDTNGSIICLMNVTVHVPL